MQFPGWYRVGGVNRLVVCCAGSFAVVVVSRSLSRTCDGCVVVLYSIVQFRTKEARAERTGEYFCCSRYSAVRRRRFEVVGLCCSLVSIEKHGAATYY